MLYEQYLESAAYINKQSQSFQPEILIILGSGLHFLAEAVENAIVVPYQTIPYCPVSTAPGHNGQLVLGTLYNKNVAVMDGRVHAYEGYSAEEIAYLVRVCRLLGAKTMVITNACGAVNQSFAVGDLVLLTDYMKFTDVSPLTDANLPDFGPRFPDMSYVFAPECIKIAKEAAIELQISLREGIYCYFTGPQYETPAEIRAVRILGADVVGMSTVPECIAARHAGMQILGISLVTNMAAGVLNQPLSEAEVLDSAQKAKPYFSQFILRCIEAL